MLTGHCSPFSQENRLRYPRIYRLALDVLPIQATSVPAERVFSSSKETITARRSRLSTEMMEALHIDRNQIL